jgi:CDP-diacylglycerol--glycerol-3-phosphate 3-phosphatidyltransferase
MIANPANLLTLSRVPLALAFLFLFGAGSRAAVIAALAVAVAIELTDFFDGRLARALGCVTDFGKLVDPFCDSFSRLTIFLAFAVAHLIPAWMVAVLLLRDLAVAFVRTVASARGIVVAARTSGKVKACVQGPVAVAIVALAAFAPEAAARTAPWLMLAATLVTLWSLVDYVAGNRTVFREPTKAATASPPARDPGPRARA